MCVKYTEEYDNIAVGFTDGIVRLYKANTLANFATLVDDELIKDIAPVTSIKHRPVSKQYPIENMLTCTCQSPKRLIITQRDTL